MVRFYVSAKHVDAHYSEYNVLLFPHVENVIIPSEKKITTLCDDPTSPRYLQGGVFKSF